MDPDTVTLRNGDTMRIARYLPPMDTFGGRVRTWDPIRDDLFSGALADTLYTPHFVGTIEGEFAGSLGYYTPADTRDVGIVEFVATEDHHRRKGVADALMARMLPDFLADGGQALHLCTTNPIAGRLYENHGFWYRVGDGMRYSAKDAADFDAAYLAFDGEPVVRDAVWGDLPRAAVLYNTPEPAWLLKDILSDCLRDTRYEYHFVRLMRRVENAQGAVLVLATPKHRAVGLAAFVRRDTFAQQHVATLSLRLAPAYMSHAVGLLRAAVDRAAEIGVGVLEFPIAGFGRGPRGHSGRGRLRRGGALAGPHPRWAQVGRRAPVHAIVRASRPPLPRVGNLLRQPPALASRAHRRRLRQARPFALAEPVRRLG